MMPSFLVLSWALTLGWIPSGNVTLERPATELAPKTMIIADQSGAMTQTVELGLTAFDTVTIWTSIETYDRFLGVTSYAPFRSDYRIGLRAWRRIGWATIETGITHECIHPVVTSGAVEVQSFGGGNQVYVKVGGSVGGK